MIKLKLHQVINYNGHNYVVRQETSTGQMFGSILEPIVYSEENPHAVVYEEELRNGILFLDNFKDWQYPGHRSQDPANSK